MQILTPGDVRVRSALEKASKQVAEEIEVLALLALQVQKGAQFTLTSARYSVYF